MKCLGIFFDYCRTLGQPSNITIHFNLQLFNQEKTEDATPKKREEARKQGQVTKSSEINATFVVLSAFLGLKNLGPYIYTELSLFMRYSFVHLHTADLTIDSAYILFLMFATVLLKTALPVMIVIAIVAVGINILQVGINFSFEPIMPKFSRLDPLAGLQRIFSKRSLVELIKSIFKVAIIGYFVYKYIKKEVIELPQLINASLFDSLQKGSKLIINLSFQICLVMLVIAALDYFYQWWEHKQNIRMSKQEVKEEYKQMEGNPQIKSKIKEKQRYMAMQRMMHNVPKADVIITNPTHFAIALSYDSSMAAPIVLAKGQDFLAQRIKAIAKEHRVTIVENKPLAQVLYTTTEVGQSIPSELFQAVAEVLAYVYKIKKRFS